MRLLFSLASLPLLPSSFFLFFFAHNEISPLFVPQPLPRPLHRSQDSLKTIDSIPQLVYIVYSTVSLTRPSFISLFQKKNKNKQYQRPDLASTIDFLCTFEQGSISSSSRDQASDLLRLCLSSNISIFLWILSNQSQASFTSLLPFNHHFLFYLSSIPSKV